MKKVIILALAILLAGFASANSLATISGWDPETNSTISAITGEVNQMIHDGTFMLKIMTTDDVFCRYSKVKGTSFDSMSGSFEDNLEDIHKKTFSGFTTSTVERYYVKCIPIEYYNNGSSYPEPIGELEAIVTIDPPISAQITMPEEYLNEGQYKISLTTTKVALDEPELSYTYDGISYKTISLQGSQKEWSGYISISSSEGEKIGSFKFSAKDLEGISGTTIISGGIFKVDTKSPSSINSLEAIGQYKQIKLDWAATEKDIDYINVYRSTSPNVGSTDFYDKFNDPEEKEYIDDAITTGKTYYYKIAPVDEAGNEASLSIEVSASSRLDNSSSTKTGLSSSLLYLVDSTVTEIETLDSEIKSSEESLKSKEESEIEFLEYAGIFDDIESATSELAALKREVVSYKLQDLTESLLNSKLDTARLRLNIIKKSVPVGAESLASLSTNSEALQEDTSILTLEYSPEISSLQLNKATRESMKMMEDNNFKITSDVRVFDITYMDGTKSKQTVITHSIPSTLERMDDYSILLKIPNSINYEDITMSTGGSQELSNYVLEFESDTKKIAYIINDEVDPKILEDIIISLVKHSNDQSTITGNSIVNIGIPGVGIAILILVVSSLVAYLGFMKKKHSADEAASFIEKAQEVKDLQKSGKHEEAKNLYESLKVDYTNLSQDIKLKVFDKVKHLHKK